MVSDVPRAHVAFTGCSSFPHLQVSPVLMECQCHVPMSSSFLLGSTAFSTLLICSSSLFSMLPVGASLEFPGMKCTLLTTCDAQRRGRLPNRLLQSAVHDLGFLDSPVFFSAQRCSVLYVKLSSLCLGLASAPPDAVAILGCPSSRVERVVFLGKV